MSGVLDPLQEFQAIKAWLLAQAKAINESETVCLLDANARVLAEAIHSPISLPALPTSAMDGYVVSKQCLENGFPARLPVLGTLFAGADIPASLPQDAAYKVMTGAALPGNAGLVIPVEEAQLLDDYLLLDTNKFRKSHIKQVGCDLSEGELLLEKGVVLGAREIGLLASCGIAACPVLRRPKVLIAVGGDELQSPGVPLQAGQIYDANSWWLQAELTELGCEVVAVLSWQDDLPSMQSSLRPRLEQIDLVISVGGVSVGDRDFVYDCLQNLGEEARSCRWRLNMKPAKPLAYATWKQNAGAVKHWLALPGNPVAAFMSFQLFAEPFIQSLSGKKSGSKKSCLAQMVQNVKADPHKLLWMQVRETQEGLEVIRQNSSSRLLDLTLADGYLCMPPNCDLEAGQTVEYWRYRR
ncbi:molybdopterin molybdotransferase MoeA [Thiomicrorhabdus heinhorstiae]|uniref:Molybdopterin molybdenumtransferase n=1 Tax=Thiomicrorhabdus heinhorstiae TaxID=2748010 RepID=A0ABS0BY39_9GAMM|nr:molybdopterin molybdotransferase MoeA [Thiomicrorhabdus heinhorstiae]MBF6058713.1 molybdopterin molybdotransferase MoeA [Thiomicrorhabdus heinhorstiae]